MDKLIRNVKITNEHDNIVEDPNEENNIENEIEDFAHSLHGGNHSSKKNFGSSKEHSYVVGVTMGQRNSNDIGMKINLG